MGPLDFDASAISIAYTDSASLSAANRTLPGPKVIAPSDFAAIRPETMPKEFGLTHAASAPTRARVDTLVKIARLRFIGGSALVLREERTLRSKTFGNNPLVAGRRTVLPVDLAVDRRHVRQTSARERVPVSLI